MSIAIALGEDSSSLSISRSIVQRRVRKKIRKEFADVVAKHYTLKYPVIIHRDGKILPDIADGKIVDCLPFTASGDEEENFLEIRNCHLKQE